jgi:hypothetical protein
MHPTERGRSHISRFLQRSCALMPTVLLSLLAVVIAVKVSQMPSFKRHSFVISDQISRKLGNGDAGHVVLVRIDESFSKQQLERLLSRAIPTLLTDYDATTVGVDIDFSGGAYSGLAQDFASWDKKNPQLAQKVVWAVGYEDTGEAATAGEAQDPFCEDCAGLSCKVRFVPKPVFGTINDPSNYALALAIPDLDNVNRSSARFVCQSQTEKPLKSFHFKLVEIYCQGRTGMATCRDLQQNKQATTKIYSWYDAKPVDLCQLVSCQDNDLGNRKSGSIARMTGKIVVVYSDVPSNDEHMTIMGARKGAEIIASLTENELQFGVAPHWRVAAMKWVLEAILTLLLIFLFHWRYTRSWAILIAIIVFALYVYAVPWLAAWVPDFADYVLAVIVTFSIEVLLKSAWQSVVGSRAKTPPGTKPENPQTAKVATQ